MNILELTKLVAGIFASIKDRGIKLVTADTSQGKILIQFTSGRLISIKIREESIYESST